MTFLLLTQVTNYSHLWEIPWSLWYCCYFLEASRNTISTVAKQCGHPTPSCWANPTAGELQNRDMVPALQTFQAALITFIIYGTTNSFFSYIADSSSDASRRGNSGVAFLSVALWNQACFSLFVHLFIVMDEVSFQWYPSSLRNGVHFLKDVSLSERNSPTTT